MVDCGDSARLELVSGVSSSADRFQLISLVVEVKYILRMHFINKEQEKEQIRFSGREFE